MELKKTLIMNKGRFQMRANLPQKEPLLVKRFEEEKLSEAFRTLPLMKRRILTMLFVEQLSPREIASHLNCSVQYVYNQRSLALKSLRRIIANRSDDA